MAERKAEKIYDKLLSEGDITWQESDVIFQIAYDCLCRKGSRKDKDEKRNFLEKWYRAVLFKISSGEQGRFLHTVLIDPRERFMMDKVYTKENSELRILLSSISRQMREQNLEEKDRVVILTFKTKEDAFGFFKEKMDPNLTGRTYQRFDYDYKDDFNTGKSIPVKNSVTHLFDKYFFEVYRPLTVTRAISKNMVKLNIKDEYFRNACATYGLSGVVYNMQEIYERVIEIMLDMNIPIYTFSTEFYPKPFDAKFDMLVDRRYEKDINRVFHNLYVIDGKFFGREKKDKELTHVISCMIKDLMIEKNREEAGKDDSWADVIR